MKTLSTFLIISVFLVSCTKSDGFDSQAVSDVSKIILFYDDEQIVLEQSKWNYLSCDMKYDNNGEGVYREVTIHFTGNDLGLKRPNIKEKLWADRNRMLEVKGDVKMTLSDDKMITSSDFNFSAILSFPHKEYVTSISTQSDLRAGISTESNFRLLNYNSEWQTACLEYVAYIYDDIPPFNKHKIYLYAKLKFNHS